VEFTIKILRFNPELNRKQWWETYTVTMEPRAQVLDALHQIKWYQDGTLTLRRSCGHGICGSDAMCINGVNRLACKTLLGEVKNPLTIEPLPGLPVIKDLVVDMAPFWESYRAVKPWMINDEPVPVTERRQSEEARQRFEDTTKCILCAACTTSCPSFWANRSYLGPAAIVQAHRFIFDDRDRAGPERLAALNSWAGVYRCRTAFNCTDACPRGIKVTRAIQEVKREILIRRL
jgi:succinate dehydrogenase / fumarate reductase, iron-sulfur subunit